MIAAIYAGKRSEAVWLGRSSTGFDDIKLELL